MSPDRELQTMYGSEDPYRSAVVDANLPSTSKEQQVNREPGKPYAKNNPDVVYGDPRTVEQIAESTTDQVRQIVS